MNRSAKMIRSANICAIWEWNQQPRKANKKCYNGGRHGEDGKKKNKHLCQNSAATNLIRSFFLFRENFVCQIVLVPRVIYTVKGLQTQRAMSCVCVIVVDQY